MKNAVLSRREREKNQHRQEVLDTALKLFSEKGFYNVSMQEIAEKSEFGIGTLYNYFESKEQLFTELMKAGIEKFQDFLVPILDSNEREDKKISEFIRSHIDLIESNIELIRLYISQYGATFVKPVYQFPSMDLEALITKKLQSVISSGVQKQIFKCAYPEIAALSICAALKAFIIESSEHFDKTETKQVFLKIEKFFLDCLLSENNKIQF